MTSNHNKQEPSERDKLIDRIELIDETGRTYVKGLIYGSPVLVRLSYQDDGRTLKVFVEPKALTGTNPSQGAAGTIITEIRGNNANK